MASEARKPGLKGFHLLPLLFLQPVFIFCIINYGSWQSQLDML